MQELFEYLKSTLTHSMAKSHVIMDKFRAYIDELPVLESEGEAYRFRFANDTDVSDFARIEAEIYNGYMAWSSQDFLRDWQSNPYAVYLLLESLENNRIIGMISGRFLARGAHISHLMVLPQFQQRHFGQQLLTHWIELVELQGIPRITLEVRVSNQSAQRLYQRHGFEVERCLPEYYSDNQEDALFLTRVSEV